MPRLGSSLRFSGLEAQKQRGNGGTSHLPMQLLKLLTPPVSGGHTHSPVPPWQIPGTNTAGASTHLLRLPSVDHSSRLLQCWGREAAAKEALSGLYAVRAQWPQVLQERAEETMSSGFRPAGNPESPSGPLNLACLGPSNHLPENTATYPRGAPENWGL